MTSFTFAVGMEGVQGQATALPPTPRPSCSDHDADCQRLQGGCAEYHQQAQ